MNDLKDLEAEMNAIRERLEKLEQPTPDKMTVIVTTDYYDKLLTAFMFASEAAAMDIEVTMFFSFWSLNALKKGKSYKGKNIMEKMLCMMSPSKAESCALSKMQMMGIGKKMLQMMMKKRNVTTLEQLLSVAMELGVKIVACSMTMEIMGVKKEELIDGIRLGGVSEFIVRSSNSNINFFL